MKRRKFIAATGIASVAPLAFTKAKQVPEVEKRQLYEFREYILPWRGRLNQLSDYLKNSLIPALNKMGVENVGVFTEFGLQEPVKVYTLIPFNSFDHYSEHFSTLKEDKDYQKNSEAYNQVSQDAKVFNRYTTELMMAFEGIPKLKVPDTKERIFEIRAYEGYNDDAVRRKVLMFNKEELDLFYETKLNPVFFGEVISGVNLPKLTYMLHFKNMEERDANWKTFVDHPEWKRMSSDPQYANTVSNIDRRFLLPLDISQI